jgi:hypothetical protein
MHLRTLSLAAVKLANDDHDTRAIQAYLGHRNIQKMFRNFFETEIRHHGWGGRRDPNMKRAAL